MRLLGPTGRGRGSYLYIEDVHPDFSRGGRDLGGRKGGTPLVDRLSTKSFRERFKCLFYRVRDSAPDGSSPRGYVRVLAVERRLKTLFANEWAFLPEEVLDSGLHPQTCGILHVNFV